MAKAKSGLPEGFDIGVTAADLAGPAQIGGYLDDDPALDIARLMKKTAPAAESEPASAFAKEERETKRVSAPPPSAPTGVRPQVLTSAPPAKENEVAASRPNPPRRRLQVNLDPEGERMVEELLALLSAQSSEREIKVSEFVQALVLNLYSARSEINLGSLPPRGRWGSPTAKSFPTALCQAFCRQHPERGA